MPFGEPQAKSCRLVLFLLATALPWAAAAGECDKLIKDLEARNFKVVSYEKCSVDGASFIGKYELHLDDIIAKGDTVKGDSTWSFPDSDGGSVWYFPKAEGILALTGSVRMLTKLRGVSALGEGRLTEHGKLDGEWTYTLSKSGLKEVYGQTYRNGEEVGDPRLLKREVFSQTRNGVEEGLLGLYEMYQRYASSPTAQRVVGDIFVKMREYGNGNNSSSGSEHVDEARKARDQAYRNCLASCEGSANFGVCEGISKKAGTYTMNSDYSRCRDRVRAQLGTCRGHCSK